MREAPKVPITGRMKKSHKAAISKAMRGKNAVYPWNRWFGKRRVRFTAMRHTDFTIPIKSMRQMIYNEASRRGLRIRTMISRSPPTLIHVDIIR